MSKHTRPVKVAPARGPKSIPSSIQLPGGVCLSGITFAVREYDAAGRPTVFEIMPEGTGHAGVGHWTFYADESSLRASGQKPATPEH